MGFCDVQGVLLLHKEQHSICWRKPASVWETSALWLNDIPVKIRPDLWHKLTVTNKETRACTCNDFDYTDLILTIVKKYWTHFVLNKIYTNWARCMIYFKKLNVKTDQCKRTLNYVTLMSCLATNFVVFSFGVSNTVEQFFHKIKLLKFFICFYILVHVRCIFLTLSLFAMCRKIHRL